MLPDNWNERVKGSFEPKITLPVGATFYSTPSHGYLEVDLRLHKATITKYDYKNGHFAYLEEDCSVTAWLKEQGLV